MLTWQAPIAGAGAREARARAATRWLWRRGVWLGRWLLESGTLRDGAAGERRSVGLAGWLLITTGSAKDTLSSGAAGLAVVGAVGLAEVGLLIGVGDGSRLMRTWDSAVRVSTWLPVRGASEAEGVGCCRWCRMLWAAAMMRSLLEARGMATLEGNHWRVSPVRSRWVYGSSGSCQMRGQHTSHHRHGWTNWDGCWVCCGSEHDSREGRWGCG